MSVLTITKDNFENEVLKSEKPVIIDFFATWCGPCRILSPIIDEIAAEHPEIKVCKVNVDEEGELATTFDVMSVPSVFVIKNGKVTKSATGARPKAQILAMLD